MLKPASAMVTDARLAKLDPYWSQPELKKNWELSNLSDQDEMRLGEELHNMIMRFNPPAPGGPWREHVHAAAKPLLARVSRKNIRYTFTILDSEAVTAFSHPGGYVYLSRGLFGFIGEDENVVLQFILAHEIAHVDLRHTIQCLQYPGVQKIQMGTLAIVYFFILPLGYLDQQEFAADQWAYRQLIGLDHTRYEALKFLRKLKGYAEAHDFNDGRARYEPRQGSSPVENHLRANTAAWLRLDELESFIDQVSTKPK
jgi:predicted Zn-dependent protease